MPPSRIKDDYTKALQGLKSCHLIDQIQSVIEIKQDFIGLTPTPDLALLEKRLKMFMKNIDKAFPNNPNGSERNSFCYRLVKDHVIAFRKELTQHCKSLMVCQKFKAAIDYALICWKHVEALPKWDKSKYNRHKKTCFKELTSTLVNSLANVTFSKQEMKSYAPKFKKLAKIGRRDNGMLNSIHIQILESVSNKFSVI